VFQVATAHCSHAPVLQLVGEDGPAHHDPQVHPASTLHTTPSVPLGQMPPGGGITGRRLAARRWAAGRLAAPVPRGASPTACLGRPPTSLGLITRREITLSPTGRESEGDNEVDMLAWV
jgi:hypothetical protein